MNSYHGNRKTQQGSRNTKKRDKEDDEEVENWMKQIPIISQNIPNDNNIIFENQINDRIEDEIEESGEFDISIEDENDIDEIYLNEAFCNNSYRDKHTKFKDSPISSYQNFFNFLDRLFSQNNSFHNFVKNKGQIAFDFKESCIPLFYQLLTKNSNKERKINSNIDDLTIKLPSGQYISKREMFLSYNFLEKQMKNTTDTKKTFLFDFFKYLFDDFFDTKEYNDLQPQRYSLFYCFCKNEEYIFENGETLFQPGDKCTLCDQIIKTENRIEVFSIIEQVVSILQRPHIIELLNINCSKISEKIHENIENNTPLTDVTDSAMYKLYFKKGVLTIDVNGKVYTIGIFNDAAATWKHSYNSKINGSSLCINELPANIRFLPDNTASFLIFQERFPLKNSIYKPLVTLLQFSYYHGCMINGVKVRIAPLFFIFDRDTDKSFFNIMKYNGFCSCSKVILFYYKKHSIFLKKKLQKKLHKNNTKTTHQIQIC
jgi:hypothetical protein